MPTTLTVMDETTAGHRGEAFQLHFPAQRITVRELIRERVHQEVRDFNAGQARSSVFRGLVRPTESVESRDGYLLRKPRRIDWEPQYEEAVSAYLQNRVLVLVNNRQTESLDEELVIDTRTEVIFLKLTPLVGG